MNQPPTRKMLERAMRNDELVLFYQPKVCLLRGKVIGAEALVRWADGGSEVISPSEFIPLAESSGLLHDLTVQLLDQVVSASIRLHRSSAASSHGPLSLSINVAPDDLASRTISNKIDELLSKGTIQAADLQIEITESAVMGNVDRVYDDLLRLKHMGIKVLMDDFGTGYSSVDRLSQLPFDALKLDQGVVKRMATSRQSLDVVRACISMARELGMTSVAEGIETAAVYNFLIAHGCEEAQGYYIARPMSLEDFMAFVAEDHDFAGSQIGRVHQTTLNLMRFRKTLIDAAFCRRVGDGAELASVANPALRSQVSETRVGLWYFGIGQALGSYPAFARLEKPLRELHASGLTFLDLLDSEQAASHLDDALRDIDHQVDLLIALLHQLERVLLAESSR